MVGFVPSLFGDRGSWDEKAAALLQLAVRVADYRVAPAGTHVCSDIFEHFFFNDNPIPLLLP